ADGAGVAQHAQRALRIGRVGAHGEGHFRPQEHLVLTEERRAGRVVPHRGGIVGDGGKRAAHADRARAGDVGLAETGGVGTSSEEERGGDDETLHPDQRSAPWGGMSSMPSGTPSGMSSGIEKSKRGKSIGTAMSSIGTWHTLSMHSSPS